MGVYNLEKVLTEFRKRRRNAADKLSTVKVGYSAPYALAVHERLDVFHPNGQAKFLEQPIRTEEKKMAEIIRNRLRGGSNLYEAHRDAAKHLIKMSFPLVPVDTGRLLNSWFII